MIRLLAYIKLPLALFSSIGWAGTAETLTAARTAVAIKNSDNLI
jgi:hypothetical protein